jgi:hypothetical protein
MRSHRSVQCLCRPILLIGLVAGCQTLQSNRPMPVLVRDAETKKPISKAEVQVSYSGPRSPLAPSDSSRVTVDDGIVRLWAAPFGDGINLDARASGYLPETKEIAVTAIEKIQPAHFFQSSDQRPPAVVMELYSEPQFSVELIVPAGYRGLVKTAIDLRDDILRAPGQRCFGYRVSPSGEVRVSGPSLLRRISPAGYHAEYDDGTPLTSEMGALKVGFRWLKQEGNQQYYVVGTQYEFDQLSRDMLKDASTGGSRDSGKSASRGGRHRRGASTAPE